MRLKGGAGDDLATAVAPDAGLAMGRGVNVNPALQQGLALRGDVRHLLSVLQKQ